MTQKPFLDLIEEALSYASTDRGLMPAERDEAAAKADFFRPLAVRLRAGDFHELQHSERACCMVLGFLLLGVEEGPRMLARLQYIADTIVAQRSLIIDMQTFAEGESDDEPE